jgi:outer membrane protein TolC
MQKPFGASGYASDESIGVVVRKTFYKGDQLTSRIENAQAAAEAQAEQVRSTYREGERGLASARQMIISMGKAVELSRANAQISRDEIAYLRKQLIIGGSTLDAVLAAEARLYEAESKEIGFVAERRKAEATILGITGKLDQLLGL